jgi:hypothetical protein
MIYQLTSITVCFHNNFILNYFRCFTSMMFYQIPKIVGYYGFNLSANGRTTTFGKNQIAVAIKISIRNCLLYSHQRFVYNFNLDFTHLQLKRTSLISYCKKTKVNNVLLTEVSIKIWYTVKVPLHPLIIWLGL